MKRGAKATVFLASMAITIASLATFAGRHHGNWGKYGHHGCYHQHYNSGSCYPENPSKPSSSED